MADDPPRDAEDVSEKRISIIPLARYPSPLCGCVSGDLTAWSAIIANAPPFLHDLLASAASPEGASVIKTVAALSFSSHARMVLYAHLRMHDTRSENLATEEADARKKEIECGITVGERDIYL